MSLTPDQARRVQATIPALRAHGEQVASVFYATLLAEHPQLRAVFNTANQATGRQPRALTALIVAFAANLAHTAELTPRLERVCHKHCSLGIGAADYAVVGDHLLRAFAAVVSMDAATYAAWGAAYGVLARMMAGREAQLYHTFRADGWTGWRPMRVVAKTAEAEDVCSFVLAGESSKSSPLPRFLPGQYVSVRVRVGGELQARQYSLSSAYSPTHYRISVKRDEGVRFRNAVAASYMHAGLVSNALLDTVRVGDCLDVSHPAGEFFLSEFDAVHSSSPLVLVSAGIGASPLLAMLETAVAAQPQRAVTYVHGARYAPPVFHARLAEIAEIADHADHADHARVKMLLFVSGTPADDARPAQTHRAALHAVANRRLSLSSSSRSSSALSARPGSPASAASAASIASAAKVAAPAFASAFAGRVDLARVAADLHLDNAGTAYYVCGPASFMTDVAKTLADLGVAPARIRCELFSTGDLEPPP